MTNTVQETTAQVTRPQWLDEACKEMTSFPDDANPDGVTNWSQMDEQEREYVREAILEVLPILQKYIVQDPTVRGFALDLAHDLRESGDAAASQVLVTQFKITEDELDW